MFSARHLVIVFALIAALFLVPTVAVRTDAMPTFAQAYGLDCKVCHSQVPSLNAYGRYVQRSMYGALDPDGYKHTFPIWVGDQVNYDSGSDSPKAQVGNLAAHFVGVYPSWTSHVQQWLVQNNDAGGSLDTAWVSYNNLFKQSGHIVLGKMPSPGPSFFSQWFDIAGFAGPNMTIGEHAQLLASNRWGGKFTFATAKGVGEAGYYGSTADLNGATDWSQNNDKGLAYHVALGHADKPVTYGFVGNLGSTPLAEGGVDRYSALGAYVQTDPGGMLPGVILYAQNGNDGNPIATGVGAHSNSYSVEVYAPLVAHHEGFTLSARREMTNDGLGTVTQFGYVNLGVRLYKYLRATGQMTMTSGSTPSWQYMIWWTTPLTGDVPRAR